MILLFACVDGLVFLVCCMIGVDAIGKKLLVVMEGLIYFLF